MQVTEYEFTKIIDLYQELEEEVMNEEGNLEIITMHIPIKEKLKVPWTCRDISKIHDFQPYYNDKGNFKKGYSTLSHDLYGRLVVKDDYNKLKEVLKQNTYKKIDGFKQY